MCKIVELIGLHQVFLRFLTPSPNIQGPATWIKPKTANNTRTDDQESIRRQTEVFLNIT